MINNELEEINLSIQFEVKRFFKVPQEEMFEALLDLDAANQWMQGLVRMERLDEGPIVVGSKWKETRKMFGTEASEHFEVVELDQPKKQVLRCDGTKGTTGKGEYIYTYNIRSVGEATEVTLHGEINGLTGFAKLMGKMIVGTFKKATAKDLDALKSYLEK